MKRVPRIIAMGGSSFAANPDNPRLERYIVAQARRKQPAVCFIGTATGDADVYLVKFYAAFTRIGCRPTHLPLFARTPDLRRMLLSQDVIYVGGGNTKSMLAVWREWGIDAILREAWREGIVLAGVSAGAICWFEAGVTDSWAGHLAALPGLGFLKGGACPHYDGEAARRPETHRLVGAGAMPATLALDDGAAAHFEGRRLVRVVSVRENAKGYRVTRVAGRVVEAPLPVVRLTRSGALPSSR